MSVGDDYHALLARHDAARLRQRLLGAAAAIPSQRREAPYDGAADQQVILRYLDLVTPFEDLVADLYNAMFTRRPYLRAMFPESMDFQQDQLASSFAFLVDHLDRPHEITEMFSRLGRGHRKLGVRPAQYEAFAEALREALRHRAGSQWVAEAEDAWMRMLGLAIKAMVGGAESALTEPAAWQATVTHHQMHAPDAALIRVLPHEPYPCVAGQFASLSSPLIEQAWRTYQIVAVNQPEGSLDFRIRCAGLGDVDDALVLHTRVGDVVRLGYAHDGTAFQRGAFAGD